MATENFEKMGSLHDQSNETPETDKLEKNLEDCNEHYRGMVEVYEEVLVHVENTATNVAKELEKVRSLPELQATSPHDRGIQDARRNVVRILEEHTSGPLTRAEVLDILTTEIDRINGLIA